MLFTTLPLEIRNMIIKLSLCTDKVIYPYPTHYEEASGAVSYRKWAPEEKLAVGLLGVSRAIRSESVNILFSKNVLRLSGQKEPATGAQYPELMWIAHHDKFRHVEITFHLGEVSLADRMAIMPEFGTPAMTPDLWSCLDRDGLGLDGHHPLLDQLLNTWLGRMPFISTLKLDSMTVDLTYCYCGFSCCRLDEFVIAHSRMLGQWHRLSTPFKSGWTSFMDNYYLGATEGMGLQKPANLEKMQFSFKGVSIHEVMKLIHRLGLGCVGYPVKDGIQDPTNCEWATSPE